MYFSKAAKVWVSTKVSGNDLCNLILQWYEVDKLLYPKFANMKTIRQLNKVSADRGPQFHRLSIEAIMSGYYKRQRMTNWWSDLYQSIDFSYRPNLDNNYCVHRWGFYINIFLHLKKIDYIFHLTNFVQICDCNSLLLINQRNINKEYTGLGICIQRYIYIYIYDNNVLSSIHARCTAPLRVISVSPC